MSDPDEEKHPNDPKTVFVPVSGAPASDHTKGSAEEGRAPDIANGRIQVGDLLNHIFEVKRLIARGGMGEVYEGINVNSDERVAIKVILPVLAADPNVQAMFRKEAKTLTRLSHPALTRYRVLAHEPRLGVLYIVTDYIDGSILSDALATMVVEPDGLASLLHRLAEGLRVAHDLGAVHRDIAPDNVLLDGGQLSGATIIDFGIAKDLDPSKGTIVGDGFAGKLNYVAPEQLGDFGREIGPWSDIYSLALVILAVASGRAVDMGATLVEAVDKRRSGVDVSAAPERLRPVLEAMLRPNPRDRLRSMTDVIAALDNSGILIPDRPVEPDASLVPPARTVFAPVPASLSLPLKSRRSIKPATKRWTVIAVGALVAILAVLGASRMVMDDGARAPRTEIPNAPAKPVAPLNRADVAAMLPRITCSWLDLQSINVANGVASVRLAGVSGNTYLSQATLSSAIAARGYQNPNIDFGNVARIDPVACNMLDAYRPLKSNASDGLISDQPRYEMDLLKTDDLKGQVGALPQIHVQPELLLRDIALVGIESDGHMTVVRRSIDQVRALEPRKLFGPLNMVFQVTSKGWSGVLAVSGQGPIDGKLIAPSPTERTAKWQAKFAEVAKAKGWRADMVWFKVVDEAPNAAR